MELQRTRESVKKEGIQTGRGRGPSSSSNSNYFPSRHVPPIESVDKKSSTQVPVTSSSSSTPPFFPRPPDRSFPYDVESVDKKSSTQGPVTSSSSSTPPFFPRPPDRSFPYDVESVDKKSSTQGPVTSSSSSTPPFFPRPHDRSFPYDVFLSFRGADTRNGFTDHLYYALVQAGIHTFRDDDGLNRGQEIMKQLMRAIEESRSFIVVFSKSYAYSSWCLDELVKIITCKDERAGRLVLPVFCGVQPFEVRRQRGSYAAAFKKYDAYDTEMEVRMVERWRTALTRAATLSGFDLESSAARSESRLISLILEEVLSQVKPKHLFLAKHPVGLDSRVCSVYRYLKPEKTDDVRVIGIYGMGGQGKTLIAKAVYNEILEYFELKCFLANVRETSQQPNGLVHLQGQLISELLMRKYAKVGNVYRGIGMIGERFRLKKVLIVLDDVDHFSQVNALAGSHNWFGPGSRIIITTRDQHLLQRVQVDEKYEAQLLSDEESLELFSWHAFNVEIPPTEYAGLAGDVVAYAGGLALALEVLGSYLFGRTVKQWEAALNKLQETPREEIQKKLKISYDGLDDNEEREVFLDIACFLIGMDTCDVIEILNGCGFNAEIGIQVLKDKCLLTVNMKNELRMHDLLWDMGREIIRQTFPTEPGKRSRLRFHKGIAAVLKGTKGTEAIEGISLVPPEGNEIHLSTKFFEVMHRLRLLQMNNVHLKGSFKLLSEEIRWLCWQECPLTYLPSNWHLANLVSLDMQHSKMSTVWQHIQFLQHLKILNLSHSKHLKSTPNFTRVPMLMTLILEGCISLLKIHPSIGCLNNLLLLNLKDCKKITTIPNEICSLKLLGHLNVNGCSNLQGLPENVGNIEVLRELFADETAITQLPSSLSRLTSLTSLSLKGSNRTLPSKFSFFTSCVSSKNRDIIRCLPSSISGLESLRRLILRDCNFSAEDIPDDVGSLSALQVLDLAGNDLRSLPRSFTQLTNLESLRLDNWSILQSLPQLPPNLETLLAENLDAPTGN